MVNAGNNAPSAPAGNVLALVSNASVSALETELAALGFRATAVDDPYAAFTELLDRPLVYRALVISLPALYREELAIIRSVRHCLPHVDVLVAHADGRHAALAEAMRLGATGLLADEAVHRLADVAPPPVDPSEAADATPVPAEEPSREEELDAFEPLLTAEELRALLQEQPTPPGGIT